MNDKPYKMWVALTGTALLAGLFVLEVALEDNAVTAVEVVKIVIAILAAIATPAGVYQISNRSDRISKKATKERL